MTNWAVFVTAPRASSKALNRAFLLIQDFEFSVYPDDSTWALLTSKELPETPPTPTRLPLPDISGTNDFAAMPFAEINAFVRTHDTGLQDLDFSTGNWVIIDNQGLETSTCLLCEQYYNSGEEAHSVFVNLDIANMGFEDFVDEDAGQQEDGSWKWASFPPDTDAKEKSEADIKRDEALRELRDGGHAD
ncbi:hypothetical protein C8R44DRAFT_735208 [Mycena epipterygia]|nr:hypothetical protein C8R44DRAFT_735208 [Mycena epipterygia]